MKRRRVKITGIGPVTPAGIGREEFWKGILEPVSRVRRYTKLGERADSLVAAYMDSFDITNYLGKSVVPKGAARQTLFAIAGAFLALQDAAILGRELRSARCAIVTGSCIMDLGGVISSVEGTLQRGARGALPRTIHTTGVGSVPSSINQALGLDGKTLALSNQCSSGLDAIGYAASMVAAGEVDIAICGGTDAPLHRFPLFELQSAGLTSSSSEMPDRQVRPFDRWRTAGAIAEGCAMLILEPEHSEREGYSYISGYSFANDVGANKCSGMIDAGNLAMAQARIRASDVEVINAWGPGDTRVDKGEAKAMAALFGSRLTDIAVVSIKGSIGSPLGAAPAIQVVAAALGQRRGMLPPTVNWEFPDPDCPLNLSSSPRAIDHKCTLVNSHGLGAVNGALVLERC